MFGLMLNYVNRYNYVGWINYGMFLNLLDFAILSFCGIHGFAYTIAQNVSVSASNSVTEKVPGSLSSGEILSNTWKYSFRTSKYLVFYKEYKIYKSTRSICLSFWQNLSLTLHWWYIFLGFYVWIADAYVHYYAYIYIARQNFPSWDCFGWSQKFPRDLQHRVHLNWIVTYFHEFIVHASTDEFSGCFSHRWTQQRIVPYSREITIYLPVKQDILKYELSTVQFTTILLDLSSPQSLNAVLLIEFVMYSECAIEKRTNKTLAENWNNRLWLIFTVKNVEIRALFQLGNESRTYTEKKLSVTSTTFQRVWGVSNWFQPIL